MIDYAISAIASHTAIRPHTLRLMRLVFAIAFSAIFSHALRRRADMPLMRCRRHIIDAIIDYID
jgi:hypothetical protein